MQMWCLERQKLFYDYEATSVRVKGQQVKLRKKNIERQKEAWTWGSPLSAELALNHYFPDSLMRPRNAFHFKATVIKVLLFAAENILIQQFILLL